MKSTRIFCKNKASRLAVEHYLRELLKRDEDPNYLLIRKVTGRGSVLRIEYRGEPDAVLTDCIEDSLTGFRDGWETYQSRLFKLCMPIVIPLLPREVISLINRK